MTLTPEQRDAWRANAIQGGTGWPHETLALLDALDEAERAVADVQLAQAVAAVTPCSCSAQRARAGRAEAARDEAQRQVQALTGLLRGFRDAAEGHVTDLDTVLRDLGLDQEAGR